MSALGSAPLEILKIPKYIVLNLKKILAPSAPIKHLYTLVFVFYCNFKNNFRKYRENFLNFIYPSLNSFKKQLFPKIVRIFLKSIFIGILGRFVHAKVGVSPTLAKKMPKHLVLNPKKFSLNLRRRENTLYSRIFAFYCSFKKQISEKSTKY